VGEPDDVGVARRVTAGDRDASRIGGVLPMTRLVRKLVGLRLGVFGKGTLVVSVLLVALCGVAWVSVHATRDATRGADVIDQEFAKRVSTDRVLLLVTENSGLVAERLSAHDSRQIRKLERELVDTDARLSTAIGSAVDGGNGVERAGAGLVARIRAAYPAYLAVRARLLHRVGSGVPRSLAIDDGQLDRVTAPLTSALAAYADVHLREGNRALAELQRAGRGPGQLLAALLALALVGLIASAAFARSVVLRLRAAADFSGRVTAGDLSTRLDAHGDDELGTLASSLNTLVQQLTSSASQRRTAQDEERAYRASQDVFSEILQVTESEQEAHDTLKLHVERGVPGSELVVLNRNNSKDRLEATTRVHDGSRLLEPLQTAKPRSCLAVRLARPFHADGTDPFLMKCEVCGLTTNESTCLPLLVGGEVIGSVLVDHIEPLGDRDGRLVRESVAAAAPILANLRNLALAEARAATDALTGLPNRRAIQDTLKRMLAHSGRTMSPLTALLIDLDHFKQINDTYGHDQGDAALAAVGDVLSSHVRASDFVGRNGGEEFIALLPDTNAAGALVLTERLRAAVAAIELPGVNRAITASFGVATYPDHAGDSEALLRLADRALYAAKGNGRNRVEVAETPTATDADLTPQ
jgi:diguanylate cyclase (GGDEF)-like protein